VKEALLQGLGTRGAAALSAVLMIAGLLAAAPARAVDDPWTPGTSWLSIRAGYAKFAAVNAPNGAAGYGVGYSRMLQPLWIFRNMSLGASVHHELLGRVAGAAIVDVPFALELDRHFLWNGGMRPYLGVGLAAHYLKGYRFPEAPGDVRGGPYLVIGGNVPVSGSSVIGLDIRAGTLSDIEETYIWSMKLNYSLVY
jgi:hypothetical protein